MPNFSGVWSLSSQLQAIGDQTWPMSPAAPTSVSAAAGNTQVTISFSAPSFEGIPTPITGYLATSTPGDFTATGSSSPLTVTGLTNGTAYTFGVQATNAVGYGAAGTSGSVSPSPPRAVVAGGRPSTYPYTTIQYVSLGTSGNFSDFGDLTKSFEQAGAAASTTRAVFPDSTDGDSNVINYITMATTGNATDFGDMTTNLMGVVSSMSSSTRGVFHSEWKPANTDLMEYITIATTGNSANFGNLDVGVQDATGCSSPTRGLVAGGRSGGAVDNIQYITIASTGNATDFGNLLSSNYFMGALSSNTRGVFGGGDVAGVTNVIQYVTIASTGNATDFGDLTTARASSCGTSNGTLGIFCGGEAPSVPTNSVEKITIATTGNATDFGDLFLGVEGAGATSSAHGGIS